MIYFLIITAGSLAIALTLPGTVELAILTIGAIMPRLGRIKSKRSTSLIVKFAVVIPAHDEAPAIGRTVASVLRCASVLRSERPGRNLLIETLVIADNCSDSTAAVASAAGARVITRVDTERRGKGFALQDTFATLMVEGFDGFLVIDADTVVDANILVEIVDLLDTGADGVQARYGVLNASATIRTRLMNVAFMAMNVLRPLGRERLGFSAGIFGNGFALTKATLEAVPYDAHSVVEDLEYHLRIVRSGRRIAFADRTSVYGEMPTTKRGFQTQRARWEGGRLRMIIGNVPSLSREVLTGRFRLIEPLLDLLLLPLGFHTAIIAGALLIPSALIRIYALSALLMVAVHVAVAVIVGGGDLSDFAALLAAPFYVAQKLALAGKIFRSARHDAAWIRTERE